MFDRVLNKSPVITRISPNLMGSWKTSNLFENVARCCSVLLGVARWVIYHTQCIVFKLTGIVFKPILCSHTQNGEVLNAKSIKNGLDTKVVVATFV